MQPTVFIVDDEEPIRDALSLLMRSVGLPTRVFPHPAAFLDDYQADWTGCLLLDVRMPHISGLELQDTLNERGCTLPVIFITGHGDVPMAVEAMRAGAVDFLQKPFNDEELIRRVQKALREDERQREVLAHTAEIRRRLEDLTPRELELARRIVTGQANKVIAAELELSARTVELHRARIMQKMGARSLAQLVRMMLTVDPPANT